MVLIDIIYRMNLRDLQYLAAVGEHLHFGRAALACHVSQPTLSMQLKKLEETLGVFLFERSNKRVLLTPIGQQVLVRARSILSTVEEMKREAASARDPEAGRVTLGLFPTLAPYLLPEIMPRLAKRFPRLSLQLVEEKTPELITQLEQGVLDAALLAMPVAQSAFEHAFVLREPFLLAVAKHHPLAKRKAVTAADMLGARLLLLEDGHCLREQALEFCHRAGAAEAASFRATSLETLRHMVASSDAVTLMPKLACRAGDGLVYLPFRSPAPHRDVALYWRRSHANPVLFQRLAALLKAAYRTL